MSYMIEDKDLDDAALWAVIDSAEASYSSSKSKPLPLKYKVTTPPQISKLQFSPSPYSRPHKIPKLQTPAPLTLSFSSPESHLSPQIRTDSEDYNKDVMKHCLNAEYPSVPLFKTYQKSAMAILDKSDYIMVSGSPFIKKSGWRKISFYFNVSFEIKDKSIEFDENRNVQRAEFIVRAYMQNGRFSDGWGSCESREKRFRKPNHDVPSTAETRAKNRACQDLIGIGEYQPGAGQFRQ